MRRASRATAIPLLACACTFVALPAASAGDGRGPVPESRDAIDDAVAGALVHAISEQLGGCAVDMRLDDVEVRPAGIGDQQVVSGSGGLRIGNDTDWTGFRFEVPYDASLGSTGPPQLSIGGVAAGEHDVPNDALLVQQLEADVVATLAGTFHQRSAWLRLDRIATAQGGSHYLRIDADGRAYPGADGGGTAMRIQALYDRSSGQWLRLHYDLGEAAGDASPAAALAIH